MFSCGCTDKNPFEFITMSAINVYVNRVDVRYCRILQTTPHENKLIDFMKLN